ncbi:MAG: GNAT family N-acetyltransferase [Actinocatenispora sp.]
MTDTDRRAANEPTAVQVRTDADIPACVRALEEVHRSDGYPVEGVEHAERWLFPDQLLQAWVVGRPDEVVAHAAVCRPDGEAAVSMLIDQTDLREDQIAVVARLFVVPTARGRALGTALARAAMDYTRNCDRHVVFDVMAKDKAAIHLYESLGCVRLGTTMHAFGDNRQVPAYCYAAPGVLPS